MARHTFTLETADGVTLQGRLDRPTGPRATVVFCHPHPELGGTMYSPLMNGVTRTLTDRGYAVLRFDFRGAGESGGTHGGGTAELADLDAAWERAGPGPKALAGWSFGAAVGLAWLAARGEHVPFAGIAPAIGYVPGDSEHSGGAKLFVIGDRDTTVDTGKARALAETLGAEVADLRGDHFFLLSAPVVGRTVADFFDRVLGLSEPA